MAERLMKNVRQDYLSCSICLEQFHEPKRLPCDHNFCVKCIENHVTQTLISRNARRYTTCPLCRREVDTGQDADEPFDAEKWASGLPIDSLIKLLLQTFERHESEMSEKYTKSQSFCQVHDGCARDTYCFTHSQLMCQECATRDHGSCEYGSAAEALHRLKPDISLLQSTVGKYLSKANEMSNNDREFAASKSQALLEISQLEQTLEEVYISAKGQIKVMKNEIDKNNGEWLEKRKTFYELVAKLLELNCSVDGLDSEADPRHVIDAFSTMKTDALKVETELKDVEQNDESSLNKVSFVENKCVRDFLSTYTGVGFIETHGSTSSDDELSMDSVPSTIAHILGRGGKNESTNEYVALEAPVNKFEWSAKFDAELRFVPSGVLLVGPYVCVIDRENEKIKQFTMNGKFVDVIRVSGQPHDATVINRLNEFAITQPDERLISFIIADESGLKSDRFLSTNIAYNGICLLENNTLVVSSWSVDCIDILDIRGNMLRSIDHSTTLMPNLSTRPSGVPDLLCVLPHGRVAITEVGCNVYCLDISLEGVNTGKRSSFAWCHAAPDGVFGICSDGRGFVYVCIKGKDEIRCITEDGELYKAAVLSAREGIRKPIAVSCHGDFVLVGQEDGVIKIFQNVDHPHDDSQ